MGRLAPAGLLAALILLFPIRGVAYETNALFLVIIDGLRNQEAFEDSTHQYIPRIWNDLAPQGTILTNFFTMVRTGTTPGHQVLVSGARTDMINNHRRNHDHFRSRYPTAFEYFRKTTGIPADSVWIVVGKRNLDVTNHSIHPAYGAEYAAMYLSDAGYDSVAYDSVITVIDTYHPRLMMVNFKEVDKQGHVGTFEDYTTAIQIADSLVYELFTHVQNDEFYDGRATFFVTTDHGRIDDLNGGYHHHGLGTHGDRSCFFVAVGPDIREAEVVEDVKTFIDVAPTIGELMGFETPFAEGRVMWEMIAGRRRASNPLDTPGAQASADSLYANLSAGPGNSLYPAVALQDDAIHVLWSEEDLQSAVENRRVVTVRSSDSGGSWTAPETLFENGQIDGTAYRGDMFRGTGPELIATANGYYGYTDPLGMRTYEWGVAYSNNPDGQAWGPAVNITGYSSKWKTIILNPPRAVIDGQEFRLDWITESWFTLKESTDGGASFTTVIDYIQDQDIPNEYLSSHDIIMDDQNVYVIAERNHVLSNELYVLSLSRETGEPGTPLVRVDADTAGSFRPCLGAGNGVLHIVWSERAGGVPVVYHRSSTDGGVSFGSTNPVSESGVESWNPDLAVSGDTVIIVWEDYRDGSGDVYSRTSPDGGKNWLDPVCESFTPSYSIHPRVDILGEASFVVWQEWVVDNWEVYAKPIEIP